MELSWTKLMTTERLGSESKVYAEDYRSEFERDWDRIVFSSAFRRMQDKTQVFPIPKSDFVHNRLTHSIEVASVGRSIGKNAGIKILKKNGRIFDAKNEREITENDFGDIVAAACLCHDIGNPPFGHSGEDSIRHFFSTKFAELYESVFPDMTEAEKQDLLKFEGNAEGFRILSNDHPSSKPGGIKLTYTTLAAFCKYPRESIIQSQNHLGLAVEKRRSQKKVGVFQAEKAVMKDVAEKLGLLSFSDNSLTYCRHPLAFLVEAADNISYQIMDLEDAHKLGLISVERVVELLTPIAQGISGDPCKIDEILAISDPGERIGAFRAKAINSLIFQAVDAFMENYEEIMSGKFDAELTDHLRQKAELKAIEEVKPHLFGYFKVVAIESAGRAAINGLLNFYFDAYKNKEQKYGRNIMNMISEQYQPNELDSSYKKTLKLACYVSRMTDNFAMNQYRTFSGFQLPEII